MPSLLHFTAKQKPFTKPYIWNDSVDYSFYICGFLLLCSFILHISFRRNYSRRGKKHVWLARSIHRACAGAIMHVAVPCMENVHFVWVGRKCESIYICCSTSVDMIITQTNAKYGWICFWVYLEIENGDKYSCALSYYSGLSYTRSVRARLRLKHCSARDSITPQASEQNKKYTIKAHTNFDE